MVTLLLTSVLILGLIAIAVYYWQKPANSSQPIELQVPEPRGLFSDFRVDQLRVPADERPEEPKVVDNKAFEEAFQAIREFQQSPNRNTTTKLMHVAALTDNAKTYGSAVELVLMSWRDGSLADLTAAELQELLNSEYWVLSSATRSSGAGFVLKRTLSTANRELQLTINP